MFWIQAYQNERSLNDQNKMKSKEGYEQRLRLQMFQ
ncbi:unnamed protein product [Paramecium sonneborni]|uniref:Uncharacterized protein n=1 Tax=Paramecium sonneborni TaxID=65129 RepID=A0A8S1MPV0_9CILI|nr:unnamed protein product [Paramecium sonneborni]